MLLFVQQNDADIDMASTLRSSQRNTVTANSINGDKAMPFMHMLPDPGMNYTFNRPLLDGTSPARLKELSAIPPRITYNDSWRQLSKKAEEKKRWIHAASLYHGAEVNLPAGDARNKL